MTYFYWFILKALEDSIDITVLSLTCNSYHEHFTALT